MVSNRNVDQNEITSEFIVSVLTMQTCCQQQSKIHSSMLSFCIAVVDSKTKQHQIHETLDETTVNSVAVV